MARSLGLSRHPPSISSEQVSNTPVGINAFPKVVADPCTTLTETSSTSIDQGAQIYNNAGVDLKYDATSFSNSGTNHKQDHHTLNILGSSSGGEVVTESATLLHDSILQNVKNTRLRDNLIDMEADEACKSQLELLQGAETDKDIIAIFEPGTGTSLALQIAVTDKVACHDGALHRISTFHPTSVVMKQIRSWVPWTALSPTAVVICPTRPLAEKVFGTFQDLCAGTHTFPGLVQQQRASFVGPDQCDILITTSAMLHSLVGRQMMNLDRVIMLVFEDYHSLSWEFNSHDPSQVQMLSKCLNGPKPAAANLAEEGLRVQRIITAFSALSKGHGSKYEQFLRKDTEPLEFSFVDKLSSPRQYHFVNVMQDEMYLLASVRFIAQMIEAEPGKTLIVCNTGYAAEMVTAFVRSALPEHCVVASHPKMSDEDRKKANSTFRDGENPVMISCRVYDTEGNIPGLSRIAIVGLAQVDDSHFHSIVARLAAGSPGNIFYFFTQSLRGAHEACIAYHCLVRGMKARSSLSSFTINELHEGVQIDGMLKNDNTIQSDLREFNEKLHKFFEEYKQRNTGSEPSAGNETQIRSPPVMLKAPAPRRRRKRGQGGRRRTPNTESLGLERTEQ